MSVEQALHPPAWLGAGLLAVAVALAACSRAPLASAPQPTPSATAAAQAATVTPEATPTPALPGVESSIRYVYIVPMSHLDIGFTAPPDVVAEGCKPNLDLALTYLERFPDLAWTLEGVWQFEQWLARTPDEAQVARALDLIRSGRLGLTAGYANLHTGLLSTAELQRFLYPGEALRQRYGVGPSCAVQNDVPGCSWALSQVLARAGIEYLLAGPNTGFGGGTTIPLQHNPFYWEGADGSRVLTWVSPGAYIEGLEIFKLQQGLNEVRLAQDLARYTDAGYPYDAILVQHAMDNWDADQLSLILLLQSVREWNRTRANPRFIISTPDAFFQHLVERYGEAFQVYRGDWSGLWEQVKILSPAGTALVRRAKADLPAGESLATLNSLLADAAYPAPEVEDLFRDLLEYDEHSVGSIVPWPGLLTEEEINHDNALRYALAQEVQARSAALLQRQADRLAAHLRGPQAGIVVLNPLSWPRTDLVSLPLPPGAADPCRLRDEATGEVTPGQVLPDGTLLFVAADVPPLGYRRYQLEPAPAPQPGPTATAAGLESPFYQVRIDRESGRLLGLRDILAGREVVEAAGDLPFNGLIVSAHRSTYGDGRYELLPAEPISLTVEAGPVVGRLLVERQGTPLVQTAITLCASLPWLEWTNVLDRSQMRHVPAQEHSDLYFFSLPLAVGPEGLQLHLETPTGFLNPANDLLPGANGRGFSVQRAAALEGADGYTVVLASVESFLLCAGQVTRAGPYLPPQEGLLLAGAMGVAHEGRSKDRGVIPLRDGEPAAPTHQSFSYRLATQAGGFDPAAAARLGWEAHTPLQARYLPAGEDGARLPAAGSFFVLDQPNVFVAELKPATFGNEGDVILRLQELSGTPVAVTVRSAFPVRQAWLASATEAAQQQVAEVDPLRVELDGHAVLTLRLRLGPAGEPLAIDDRREIGPTK